MAVMALSCCNKSTGVLLHRVLLHARLQRGPFTPVWHWRMALQWAQTTSHSSSCPSRWQRSAKGPCSINKNSVQPIVLRDYMACIITVNTFFHKKLGSEDSFTRKANLICISCKMLCQFSHRVITKISIPLCSFALLVSF